MTKKRKSSGGDEEEYATYNSNKHQQIFHHHVDRLDSVEFDGNIDLSLSLSPAFPPSSPLPRSSTAFGHRNPPPSPVPPPPPPLEEVQPRLHQLPLIQTPLELSHTHPILSRAGTIQAVLQGPMNPNPTVQRASGSSRTTRARRNPTEASNRAGAGAGAGAKSETITVPFPWATDRRAIILSKDEILAKGIHTIHGDVQCKKCERVYTIEYDFERKFKEVFEYIAINKHNMHHRAPSAWMCPTLPTCKFCGQENSCKPVISEKKRSINWLFLLLGQFLGCCTLEQLKYFCKHTKNHRTGAKDRVLYLAYLALCKQLDPTGPFDYP